MVGVVLDIETTGYLKYNTGADGVPVLSDESEILEVGYMIINMETTSILNHGVLYFYKPYFNIESDAQRVHGLQREFLKNYENDFKNNLIALAAMLQNTCIIGKNSATFDEPFIKAFLLKHGGDKFDYETLVLKSDMSRYDGGKVIYNNNSYTFDLQKIFKDTYHSLYEKKYSITVGKNIDLDKAIESIPDELITPEVLTQIHNDDKVYRGAGTIMNVYYDPEHPRLNSNKKGTLSQYVDVIPGAKGFVDKVYNGLDKDRVTGAHGALYDVVATYAVWYYYHMAVEKGK